jgi:hypothetical protein
VKANAYGHGDVAVARTLVAAGVERLAVATVDEGLRLRDAGIAAPIVVLWGIGPAEAPRGRERARADRLRRSVDRAARVAGATNRSACTSRSTPASGARAPTPAMPSSSPRGSREPPLELAGTMSHLAVPGEDDAYTEVQLCGSRARSTHALAGIDPGSSTSAPPAASSPARPIGRRDPAGPRALRPPAGLGVGARGRAAPALSLKALPLRIFDLRAGEASAMGSASGRSATRESPRSASATATDGRGRTRTKGSRSCEAARADRRSGQHGRA